MLVSKAELFAVLLKYNPWWNMGRPADLPPWKRAAFTQIRAWRKDPPAGRALLLTGARQVGKTTLYLQTIDEILGEDVPPSNILYATFDHPLLKLVGLEKVIETWKEYETAGDGPEYLFLDEVQTIKDWQVWLKHQVDFEKHRRIAITGSATPLLEEGQESGVGRWQTIKLATLSFFEYLQIRNAAFPPLPRIPSLMRLFDWTGPDFARTSEEAKPLSALFDDYLLRGGFPQSAKIENIDLAQKLLREDIVDKVLKRDMTALFGVRRVVELEQVFLYLCMNDGGLLDMKALCSNLEVKKATANNFITLLESAHLVYKLMPYGYGKEILRAQPKVYLADAALAGSVLLKGKSLLENPEAMGRTVETAFFKHVFTRYYSKSVKFAFWRGKNDREVDIIADMTPRLVPFEIKYRGREHTGIQELKGMCEFCEKNKVSTGYVITRDMNDFGIIDVERTGIRLAKIPAPLACFWLGASELDDYPQNND
ncbi:MAG: ATP-binding protein [Opitutales bacterium]|jgi:hypothetical protein